MSASMKAVIHMRPDYTEILKVYKNTNFEELQNLFHITQKLVRKPGESLNVRMIECASRSWTRSSLAHDQAIKWSKAKVQVYSDSVLCLGKMTGIDGEPIEFEWNTFPGLTSLDNLPKKSRKTCKNKTLNLKLLKTESCSCRCSMTLIGREEEIQNSVFQIPNKSRTM